MESKRQAKFSRVIQKDMGEIFLREGKDMFGLPFISVTEVKVTPDLSYARIYLSFMNEKEPAKALNLIRQYNKELRLKLGSRIRNDVKKIPEIEFYYDESLEYTAKMDQIFEEIHKKEDAQGEVKVNKDEYKGEI